MRYSRETQRWTNGTNGAKNASATIGNSHTNIKSNAGGTSDATIGIHITGANKYQ